MHVPGTVLKMPIVAPPFQRICLHLLDMIPCVSVISGLYLLRWTLCMCTLALYWLTQRNQPKAGGARMHSLVTRESHDLSALQKPCSTAILADEYQLEGATRRVGYSRHETRFSTIKVQASERLGCHLFIPTRQTYL
jgi:hypothetical protein